MKIAVYGAGAVGAYFGGRLAEAGCDVTFIARGAQLDALRLGGLVVESLAGDFHLHQVEATDRPEEVGPVDAIIVAVKAWQIEEVGVAMRPMLGPETMVVPLQNGVDAPDAIARSVGESHALGGLCGIVAELTEPGHVRHTGAEPRIAFGELDNRVSARASRLNEVFNGAVGVTADIPADIHVALWRKFMLICPWSGLGAITRSPPGTFRSEPYTRELLKCAIDEVATVGRAKGVNLPEDAPAHVLQYFDTVPASATASMQRDIMAGRPSELEVQNGAVVRLGRASGVDTPVNAFIYHALLPMERRARGEIDW